MLKKTKAVIADAGRTVSTCAALAVAAIVVALVALAVAVMGRGSRA